MPKIEHSIWLLLGPPPSESGMRKNKILERTFGRDSLWYSQCDQIGRFLKDLGDMVSIKSSPNAW